MTESERTGYDAGTFTHSDDCFDDLCGYTGAWSAAMRAKLKEQEGAK